MRHKWIGSNSIRLPVTALIAASCLAGAPVSAGGLHHYKTYHSQQLMPAGNYSVLNSTLVAATPPTAGFVVPTGMTTASFITAPGITPVAGYYYPTSAGFVTAGTPTAHYYASNLVSATPPSAGFSIDETAAYSASPNLAAYLGGNFPAYRRALVAHAQTLKGNGATGFQSIFQALKTFAINYLPQLSGLAFPGSGPLVTEIENLLKPIITGMGVSAANGDGGGGSVADMPPPIVINVTCDGKTTTTTVDPVTRKTTTGRPTTTRPGTNVPVRPPHPGTPPAAPTAGDAQPPDAVPLPPTRDEPATPTIPDEQAAAGDTEQRLLKLVERLERASAALEMASQNLARSTAASAGTTGKPPVAAAPTTGGAK